MSSSVASSEPQTELASLPDVWTIDEKRQLGEVAELQLQIEQYCSVCRQRMDLGFNDAEYSEAHIALERLAERIIRVRNETLGLVDSDESMPATGYMMSVKEQRYDTHLALSILLSKVPALAVPRRAAEEFHTHETISPSTAARWKGARVSSISYGDTIQSQAPAPGEIPANQDLSMGLAFKDDGRIFMHPDIERLLVEGRLPEEAREDPGKISLVTGYQSPTGVPAARLLAEANILNDLGFPANARFPNLPIITYGGTESLDFTANMLVTPGRTSMLLNNRTWETQPQSFRSAGAIVHDTSFFGENGELDLDAFDEKLDKLPAGNLLVLMTDPLNPTGRTMSDEEGRALRERSDRQIEKGRHRFTFIFDDAYGGFVPTGDGMPTRPLCTHFLEQDDTGRIGTPKGYNVVLVGRGTKNLGGYSLRYGTNTYVSEIGSTDEQLASDQLQLTKMRTVAPSFSSWDAQDVVSRAMTKQTLFQLSSELQRPGDNSAELLAQMREWHSDFHRRGQDSSAYLMRKCQATWEAFCSIPDLQPVGIPDSQSKISGFIATFKLPNGISADQFSAAMREDDWRVISFEPVGFEDEIRLKLCVKDDDRPAAVAKITEVIGRLKS